MIFIKYLKVLLILNFTEKYLHMMFNNVPNGVKGFLGYKNVSFSYWDNVHFFLKGLAHDFPQTFKISSKSAFLWKIPRHDV